jgi:site-specific DNA-methyltransferase (adenine-specific)
LRAIISLTPAQQLTLVKDLAAGRITKDKFKAQAERFKARNLLTADAERLLGDLPPEYLPRALAEIEKGGYDKSPRADFDKLIQQLRDEHAKKQNYTVLCADIRSGLAEVPDASIDAIITDPPYPREFLPLYGDLAQLAARVLKPGGSLLVMCGQSYLPDVLNLMTPYLAYHWTIAYLTPGGQAVQLWQRNVNTFWKPVLWFVNGDYTGKWAGDVSKSEVNDNDKRFHEWGQSESGMADLVNRCTKTGETILDPFCGAGTTGVAALRAGRRFIGADSEPTHVETTRRRLTEASNG